MKTIILLTGMFITDAIKPDYFAEATELMVVLTLVCIVTDVAEFIKVMRK